MNQSATARHNIVVHVVQNYSIKEWFAKDYHKALKSPKCRDLKIVPHTTFTKTQNVIPENSKICLIYAVATYVISTR